MLWGARRSRSQSIEQAPGDDGRAIDDVRVDHGGAEIAVTSDVLPANVRFRVSGPASVPSVVPNAERSRWSDAARGICRTRMRVPPLVPKPRRESGEPDHLELQVSAWNAGWPQMRWEGNGDFGRLGLGTTLIDGDAKAQWEALANSVGPDMVRCIQSYPLKFRWLQDSGTCRNASIANGYSTRYSEMINCSEKI